MLAERFLIALTILGLTSGACGQVSRDTPLLGSRGDATILNSSFCRKYKCVRVASNGNSSLYTFHLPGNKWASKGLKPLKDSVQLEFKFVSGRIITGVAPLKLYFPDGGMPGEYAELANDFVEALTGRLVIDDRKYSGSGAFDGCFGALFDLHEMHPSVRESVLLTPATVVKEGRVVESYVPVNKTKNGYAFQASCWQPGIGEGKMNSGYIVVRLKE